MSTRSFVTRQRDHRRDRGKSLSNAMVNDVSETEPDAEKALHESDRVTPDVFFPSE